jgi:hypothetical protein
MPHPLQATINRLPELLERNAPQMMRRIVAHIKGDLGSSQASSNASHALLLLKVAEEDLVASFVSAVQETFETKERGMFEPSVSLSLEPESGNEEEETAAFVAADAAFTSLCRRAADVGVHGAERYKKSRFLTAMKDAFARARMDERATVALMPAARSALNAELRALYAQLETMTTRAQG